MKDYILALDQGTTSSRALVFDRQGQVIAMAQQEFAQHFPQSGWVEHDAGEIWRSQLAVARQALERASLSAARMRALAITNQRETTVLWDRRSGEAVGPAIVWQDRRTAAQCDALRTLLHSAGKGALIQRKTGLRLDPYFSATKLAWLLDHVPGARARAEAGELAFGTVDSWLLWNLMGGPRGGVHATDASNAARTLLFNIHTQQWDEELLRLFRIPHAVLPQVRPSSGVFGETDPVLLGAALPVAGVAGDQSAATFGQACFAPGMAKNTYGTGCFMLMNTGDAAVPSGHQLLGPLLWQGPPSTESTVAPGVSSVCYALEGSVFMGGATVQWLRDGLQIIRSSEEVEALAASVPDAQDVHLVPAFTGLGAPDWDARARGLLIGMTRGTTRAHIARAALDAIAWQVADVFEAMRQDVAVPLRELRVDGGASRNDLLMQMQADALGVSVLRPVQTETTAWGVAALAGLATGLWSGADELAALWRLDKRFEPQLAEAQRQARHARWREAVERAKAWAEI